MSQTVIRGTQILNNTVQRQDLDTSTVGQALVTKIVQGSGITLSSTGADSGTGDVTVSSPDVVSTDAGNIATLGTDNHILVPQSQIWSVRLRSINILGNPTMEVDQRLNGTFGIGASTGCNEDRWMAYKAGTMTVNGGLVSGLVSVPGTSFAITQKYFRFTLTGQQASLGTSDVLRLAHFLEGIQLRELISDVSSCQVLVRSSVAGLSFGVALRDSAAAYSLTKLITVPSANTWSLLTMPNLPIWTASGNFPTGPGVIGAYFDITLAAGSAITSPANNTYQAGNFVGAVGQSNFAAQAVNSTFDIAFVQHEPGALCTTPMDCPFTQNYDDCLRYYCKSYEYGIKPGTASQPSDVRFIVPSNNVGWAIGIAAYPKPLAIVPTVLTTYGYDGTANAVTVFSGANVTVTNKTFGSKYLSGVSFANQASGTGFQFHYTADTGW